VSFLSKRATVSDFVFLEKIVFRVIGFVDFERLAYNQLKTPMPKGCLREMEK